MYTFVFNQLTTNDIKILKYEYIMYKRLQSIYVTQKLLRTMVFTFTL